jgi:hypothetical protein
MEKRSRQRVRDQVALTAFGAETRMRSSARGLSMMARNATVPLTGRIQKRKTNHLQIVIFGLQRAAGSPSWHRRPGLASRRYFSKKLLWRHAE